MKQKRGKSAKSNNKDNNKKKKGQVEAKNKQKDKDYQRLEEYLNESGLSLAFNIIFAELISKQILPENFFTYTSMRLTQIGKEIEGLKTKETVFVDENEEEQKNDEQNNGPQQVVEQTQEENKELLFMTRPEQNQAAQPQPQNKNKNKQKKK